MYCNFESAKGPESESMDCMWICMFNEMNERTSGTFAVHSGRLGLVVDSSGEEVVEVVKATAAIAATVYRFHRHQCRRLLLCMCLLGNFINFILLSPKNIRRTSFTVYLIFIYFVLTAATPYPSIQSAS